MKAVVVYATKYGSTAQAAAVLAQAMNADAADVAKEKPDLGVYDAVVLGSPIFMGKLPGKMDKYVKANSSTLLGKRLGIFICCASEGEEAVKQIGNAFPPELVAHASRTAVLGGAIILEKFNFLFRAMLKKTGVKESFSRLDKEEIGAFASAFKQ